MGNHKCLTCDKAGGIVATDKHTQCINCLGDEHFVPPQERVCEECLGLGKSWCIQGGK